MLTGLIVLSFFFLLDFLPTIAFWRLAVRQVRVYYQRMVICATHGFLWTSIFATMKNFWTLNDMWRCRGIEMRKLFTLPKTDSIAIQRLVYDLVFQRTATDVELF